MTKVFVVTTVVKEQRGQREVTLGAYINKEQALQVAQESLTTEGGVLCQLIAVRKKEECEVGLVERIEGNTTMWGIYTEGADWHTETSFWMAAKVEEVEVR
jgi:hypothetical protein